MSLIHERFLSTWIIGALNGFLNVLSVGSEKPAVDWRCPSCGCVLNAARAVDGTLSVVFGTPLPSVKQSLFRHSVVLTPKGNCSIYCEPYGYEKAAFARVFGSAERTSFSEENSGKPCGCDPGANHICERHSKAVTDDEAKPPEATNTAAYETK